MYNRAIDSIVSAWTGHRDFAIWLVKYLEPSVIVDLGVDYGFSTFCFATPNIGMVYGVDWFAGDEHTGLRDTYQSVCDFKDEHGYSNVSIIKSDFNALAEDWVKSIDILHIDGLHTYEAVKNDFKQWEKFTHNGSVILFHDTVAFSDTVGKFFNEITYPKFNFTHSAGLGVVVKNRDTYNDILTYIRSKPDLSKYLEVRECNYE